MSASLRARRCWGALVGLLCGLVALGPALAPGYLLFYDMVFVPHLGLSQRTLGVDGSVPRAVPNDLIVALLSYLAPGWVVQKALLLAVFVGVAAGVAGLMRSRPGAVAAAVAACWNPYVAERLAIGHWGFLLGYACLPWVATAATACRDGRRHGRARLATALVVVALTGSTGAVLALLLVLCLFVLAGAVARARPVAARPADLGWIGLIALLANAPWWLPYLTVTPGVPADATGVEAFMSRSDTPFGVVASLLTGGGIWNRGVWFGERQSVVVAGLALVGVIAALVGWVRAAAWRHHAAGPGLALAGVLGMAVAALSAVIGGSDLVTWVVTTLPGGGLLRDSQKFIAVWVLLVAVAVGTLAEAVRGAIVRRAAGRVTAVVVALAVAAWPVVTLPGMAAGALGRWQAVDYPPSQLALAEHIDALPPGSVAVFPWTLYRRYAWDGNRIVLDPWQRLVDRDVVINDDLPLSNRTVRGENLRAQRIGASLAQGGDTLQVLRGTGVRYVLVLTDQPRRPGVPDVSLQRVVATADGATLYDLGGQVTPVVAADSPWRYTGLAGGGAAVLLAAGAWLVPSRRRPNAAPRVQDRHRTT